MPKTPEQQPPSLNSVETEPKVSFVQFLRHEIELRLADKERLGREQFARETRAYESLLCFLPTNFDTELPQETVTEISISLNERVQNEHPTKVAMEIAKFLMLRYISERKQ